MTDYFFGILCFSNPEKKQRATQRWKEQVQDPHLRFEIGRCDDEWFAWLQQEFDAPPDRSVNFYIHTDEPEGFGGFPQADHLAYINELFQGRRPTPLVNYLSFPVPQPLIRIDWKHLDQTAQGEPDSVGPSVPQNVVQRAAEFCKSTRFFRYLNGIWQTDGLQRGMFVLSEGWSVKEEDIFPMSFQDMLKDLWLHYCFGYVDVDTAYLVEK